MFCKKVFNKFDAKKGDSSLVTARSKYHLHVNEWEKAVSDARVILEESSNTAQAYLSKVEGLFNLCCFEEVIIDSITDDDRTFIKALVTSKRGEQNFQNDPKFPEWSNKCMLIIKETLHKNVFLGFNCKNGSISAKRPSTKLSSKHMKRTARKSKDLERLQDEAAYLVWVSKALKSSQIPWTEDYEYKMEPVTVMKAREFALNMTSKIDKTIDQLKSREQFWLCLK